MMVETEDKIGALTGDDSGAFSFCLDRPRITRIVRVFADLIRAERVASVLSVVYHEIEN